jgi:hypothetical protein
MNGRLHLNGLLGNRGVGGVCKTSGGIWPLMIFSRPDESPLCIAHKLHTVQIACDLDSSGTHTILAMGRTVCGTGDYLLFIQRHNLLTPALDL